MTDNMDRRRAPRLDLEDPVMCRIRTAGGDVHRVEIINISEGGVMLSSRQPLVSLGEKIDIEIRVGERPIFEASAKVTAADPLEIELFEDDLEKSEVRWVSGSEGKFGIQFLNLKSESQTALRQLIDELNQK